jgi:hypothetical protein
LSLVKALAGVGPRLPRLRLNAYSPPFMAPLAGRRLKHLPMPDDHD